MFPFGLTPEFTYSLDDLWCCILKMFNETFAISILDVYGYACLRAAECHRPNAYYADRNRQNENWTRPNWLYCSKMRKIDMLISKSDVKKTFSKTTETASHVACMRPKNTRQSSFSGIPFAYAFRLRKTNFKYWTGLSFLKKKSNRNNSFQLVQLIDKLYNRQHWYYIIDGR